MPVIPQVQTQVGTEGNVILNSVPLRVKTGTYQRQPAPRFGEKISQGAMSPNDFNPYESATTIGQLIGGYGVRRYIDVAGGFDAAQFNYKESSNVDCRAPGICLSPAITNVSLPGSTATPVWMGEWTASAGAVGGARWVIVAGTKVYYLSAAGTAVDTGYTLPAPAVQGAIIAVGGQLLIGYGSAHTAQYITTLDASVGLTDVLDTTPHTIYVFAATADRAAVYVAGGQATTNNNVVLSSATTAANPAQSFGTSGTTCGSTDAPITSLAPGGGLVLVYVSKTTELGMIDSASSIYHQLLPFYSRLATNGVGLSWYMGTPANETQGPLILVFPRGRSLWSYQPSNQNAGSPMNLAPWGKAGFRPSNARGIVTAFVGTPHYLYYSVKTSGGNAWIIANDANSGANHTYRFNGANTCQALGVTSLFGTNPLLYMGFGNNIAYITLPADGDYPPDDPNCSFDSTDTCTLDLPDIDLGFPDEDKIAFYIRIVADNLVAAAQQISVSFAIDGSTTYTALGTVTQTPEQDLLFPVALVFKRLSLRLTLSSTDSTKTPILNGVSVRVSMNPKQYTLWSFDSILPEGQALTLADSTMDVQSVVTNFWTAYKAGIPVTFQDNWFNQWWVRILNFTESWLTTDPQRSPDVDLSFTLLEVANGPGNLAWDSAQAIYDASWSIYA